MCWCENAIFRFKQHASTNLIAKAPDHNNGEEGATPSKQPRLDFKCRTAVQSNSQVELNKVIARYVAEDMHPMSTVQSAAFRHLISKKPVTKRDSGQTSTKTFSSCLDREYAYMEVELKKTFEGSESLPLQTFGLCITKVFSA